jgi:hypothetical protein
MPLAHAGPSTVRAFPAWARGRVSWSDAIPQLTEFNVAISQVEIDRHIVLDV